MKRFSLLTLCLMTFYCTTVMSGSDEECVLEARVSAKRSSNSSKVPEATPAAKRSHQQSAAERCKEIITAFLAQQEDFVTSPSLEMHETSKTIPQRVRKETLRVKGILVKGFLFSRRQEEIGAYENGSMSGLFLNFEKCLKPLSKLVAPPLPKLTGKKDPDELSRRIHQLFETFDQGPLQPKFEFLSTVIFQNDHNQIGTRLDRFLTFCEHQQKKHDEIQNPLEKAISKQNLLRYHQALHAIGEACIDRSLSGLDEAEQLMRYSLDSTLLTSPERLTAEQVQLNRYKLIHQAMEEYKKYLLMAFTAKICHGSANNDESREGFLINLIKVQRSLGLPPYITHLKYYKSFCDRFEKSFLEIIDFIASEISVEGFLGFISGIQEIPDEGRQWLYQKTVLEEQDFDETFYNQLTIWSEASSQLIPEIESKGTDNTFFMAFHKSVSRGEEAIEAYEPLMRSHVAEQAKKDLQSLGYAHKNPYYFEKFSPEILYGSFYR